MEENYKENDYEMSESYRKENKNYSIKIIKIEEEKHQKDLEKMAIELLNEEYADL